MFLIKSYVYMAYLAEEMETPCTPGDGMEIIFTAKDDFKFGMWLIRMVICLFPGVHFSLTPK